MEDQRNRFIPNIRAGRTLALLSLSGLIVLAIASACGPFSDDGDDNASGSSDPDREVVMSTFTPTIEGATPEAVFTREARQTEAVQTATAVAANPDAAATQAAGSGSPPPVPSNLPTVASGEVLAPPAGFLQSSDDQIDSTYGSFNWQFEDDDETFARISVPFMEVTDYGLSAPSGSDVTFIMEDPGIAGAPVEVKVTVYDFESTATIPYDDKGTILSDKPTFVPRADVIKHIETTIDLNDPTITLDLAPNQYIVFVQARWPNHPVLEDQLIFVNYVFNVFVE